MHARLPVHAFHDAMTLVDAVHKEGLLLPEEDQLRIHGVPPERTETVTVAIDSDEFATYKPAEQPVGIDAERLAAFLDLCAPTAPLNCTSPPHSNRVSLSTTALQYRVDPIDPQCVRRHDTDTPPEQPPVSMTMPTDFDPLSHSLRAADLCGPTIRIHTVQDDPLLGFTAPGDDDDDDGDSMRYQVHHDELHSSDMSTTTAEYPLDTLRRICETLRQQAEELTVLIDDDQSLTITASHSQFSIRVRYTLAAHATASESDTTEADAIPSPLAYRTREERRVSEHA